MFNGKLRSPIEQQVEFGKAWASYLIWITVVYE